MEDLIVIAPTPVSFFERYAGLFALVLLIVALIIFVRNYKEKDEEQEEQAQSIVNHVGCPLDLNDEDATVASLIAAIECRNETNKNVHVISVKEVK